MNIPKRLQDMYDEAGVKKFLAETPDWTARCRLCGEHLEGTMEQLKGHVCKVKHD